MSNALSATNPDISTAGIADTRVSRLHDMCTWHVLDVPDYWVIMPSGLRVPQATARRIALRERRPICIDLFCGCGGASLGFIEAGFEVIAGLDNDPLSAMTYLHNLGAYPVEIHYADPNDKSRLNACIERENKRNDRGLARVLVSGGGWRSHYPDVPGVSHFFFGDVRRFTGEQILAAIGMKPGEVDCVFGGPPCQGFSTSGRRDVMDPRNSLVFEFARLVVEIQPKSILFENVSGILDMVTPEGLPVIEAFSRVLEDGGFGGLETIKRALLTTAGCGAALRGQADKQPKRNRSQAGPQQVKFEFDDDAGAPGEEPW